jgi:formylglycine-generating enzyme required for sulfatase activity
MQVHELKCRVDKLGKGLSAYSQELQLALHYVQPDAASSLTKSRIVLEKLLVRIYTAEMGREPRKPLLADMLLDTQFTKKIERRVLSRMNAIRDMGNLGPHGEAVEPTDAARVLDDLCEVLEWYLRRTSVDVPALEPVKPPAPPVSSPPAATAMQASLPMGTIVVTAKGEGKPKAFGRKWKISLAVLAVVFITSLGYGAYALWKEDGRSQGPQGPARLVCSYPTGTAAGQAEAVQKVWAEYLKIPIRKAVGLGEGVSMELVFIPPGDFMMGSPTDEPGRALDSVEFLHGAEISKGFYISVIPVTQQQYEAVMGNNPSYYSWNGGGKDKVAGLIDTKRFPVESVSWNDAKAFCRKLSAANSETYQLPSEAQWEYACRAGTRTAFHYGNNLKVERVSSKAEPYTRSQSAEMGLIPANAFGLFEIHGKVWQWCEDIYAGNYYNYSPFVDPLNLGQGERRVMRGGSWKADEFACRAAARGAFPPDSCLEDVGFRVVLLLP